MVGAFGPGRVLEDDQQRDYGDRRKHQQLVIVDIRDDLRLLSDQGVERRPPGSGDRIEELGNRGLFERTIDGGDMRCDLGVVHLRIVGNKPR
jgi:hypothetical protein